MSENNRFPRLERSTRQADAFEAASEKGAAIAALQPMLEAFSNPRLRLRIEVLTAGSGAPGR